MSSMDFPVIYIANGVLLPGAALKLPIRSRNNIETIEKFLMNGIGQKRQIVVAYRIGDNKVYEVATLAEVDQIVCWSFNSNVQVQIQHYTLHVVGVARVAVEKIATSTCKVRRLEDVNLNVGQDEIAKLTSFVKRFSIDPRIVNAIDNSDCGRIADLCVAQQKHIGYLQLLDYLSQVDVVKRVDLCISWMKIDENTKGIAVKQPGEFRRRDVRKKAKQPVEEIEERLANAQLPENIEDQVMSELERLKGMNKQQSEYGVLLNWLELVANLPWNKSAGTNEIDIIKARTTLDESHDAMLDVKQRVLEHLAVCKLNDNVSNGMILCFSGPPGIGKTSIARAIAQSMGRKFERISLGGIRDESDIRGHRRTYVASMPGRIIEAVKRCGVNDPVLLLDEVDKLYSGNSGSPSAALLELLDPEQNHSFHDHYLNMPFDMSKVMFIATANDLSNIEPALRDRLEIIEMSGYSLKEKLKIAQNHLCARQLAKNGICPDYLDIRKEALEVMVEEYTMEAGVRQLERHIGAVCRHAALRLAEALNASSEADVLPDMQLPIHIDVDDVHKILKAKHRGRSNVVAKMRPLKAGVCFGLSVSSAGGQVMPIEASKSEGSGKIVTTGQLGKVLEESIHVASAWLAANSKRYSVDNFKSFDVHVHLPQGGVPKDGPSAGCGLLSALASTVRNVPLRDDTAITGEISLSGQVLPVGGIKEKVLAAQREGLRRVVLPEANREDVEKLDDDVKNSMQIVFVDNVDQVLQKMFAHVDPILSKL